MADHVAVLEEAPEVEFVGIQIDDQLLDHLGTIEGCMYVWKENLDPVVVEDNDIRDALQWVLAFMKEHREAPSISILSEETGFGEFREPVAPIEYVVKKLRDIYSRKELRRVVSKVGRLSGNPEEAMAYGVRELGVIQAISATKGSRLSSDDMLSTLDRYQQKWVDGEGQGVSFGYGMIDEHLGGLKLGELTFCLGRPKRYKSWQAIVSADTAWEEGETPCIQTMEMGEDDMLDRWVCMRAGVSWSKFKHGLLSEADFALVEKAIEYVHSFDHKIHFMRPQAGNRNVPYLVNTAQEVGATVMYIDQLSWFDDAKDPDKNWLKIGRICEQLKDASLLFPVYCLAQYSREAVGTEGIADLSKIALSDMIGQTADLVMGLYASSEMIDQGVLHFGVVESRSFEHAAWEIKVGLSDNSNFKLIRKLDPSFT